MVMRAEEQPAWLAALAEALVEALPRLAQAEPDPRLAELIRALTAALARGEPELRLHAPAPAEVDARHWPDGHRQALEGSPLAHPPLGPLVLDDGRIVWRRWWERRQSVLENLIRRAQTTPSGAAAAGEPRPEEPAAEASEPGDGRLDPDQRRAVAAVLHHRLVLLQGGPGTGKTSTVARMLARVERHQAGARLHLAAPTGKAAARLRAASGGRHPCTTLHRLLESRGEGFARNRHNPLPLDLLVVDEVSMVDLGLMEALLEALPDSCRLVLVGDPAQLPPVAPGALLPELQRPALQQALGAAAITLRTVHRNDGAIAAAAAQLRQGIEAAEASSNGAEAPDPLLALRELLEGLTPQDNLRWYESAAPSLPEPLLEPLQRHRQRLAERAAACVGTGGEAGAVAERALLAERDRLLVLVPRRRGRWGVEAIHRALLGPAALADPRLWPAGTPVLCTRNLPELNLANGDLGVVLAADPLDGTRWLLFGSSDAAAAAEATAEAKAEGEGEGEGTLRVHPAQLAGSLEPALALTVHKAQGSEAEMVIVLLPGAERPDGRLLYTALTRARRQARLICAAESRSVKTINET
jgi:exodeoxyribonuclease V alpha subunit